MKTYLFIILSSLVVTGCSLSYKEPAIADNKFCIPDSILSQITVDTISVKPIIEELNLIGKVTYDQDKVVKLYPMVSGNVIDVKVSLGDYVEKGQVLAVVKSTEITGAENDIVTAQSNLAVSEKNLAAMEDMYKSGITSEKDYTSALKETEKARSELNKAKTVLSIYGGKQSDYIVSSPISGYIVEKFVNPNMQIRPDNATNLFTISDLRKVWVLANVYESDISNIKMGAKASITTVSYPDKKYTGYIDKIYNLLDPDNKTMKVRIQLDNKDNLLKPEMFAKVIIHQVKDSAMLAVPSKSIVFDRDKYWVMVCNDKCNVQTKQVDIVESSNLYAYVRSDVKPGEKVITNLQLFIYNALNP